MFSLPCPLHFCSKVLGETVNISDLALMTSFPSYLSQFLPDRGHFGIRCSIQLFSRSTHGFWIKRRGFHQFFIYRSIPVTLFVNITSLKGFRDWEPESLCFLIIYIWANDNDGMIKKKFFSAGILAILRVIVQNMRPVLHLRTVRPAGFDYLRALFLIWMWVLWRLMSTRWLLIIWVMGPSLSGAPLAWGPPETVCQLLAVCHWCPPLCVWCDF